LTVQLLITTLAESQTCFWPPVELRLRELGDSASFLSFDDRSTEALSAAGLEVFPANDPVPAAGLSQALIDALFIRFGIHDLNHWFGHERYAFGLRDSGQLRCKLATTLLATDAACQASTARGPTALVQDLGVFLLRNP
jgi:hypothetical protein